MLLAKIKEKLFNRKNKVEIEDVEVNGEIPASIKALIESLSGTSLKVGNYKMNTETEKVEWVEELPEDFTGDLLWVGDDDSIGIEHYENGDITISSYMYAGELIVPTLKANNIDFSLLTHSFNELDPTLKALCESSITDKEAKPCTQAQWDTIKSLVDKSLYFNYSGINMIKSSFDGISSYRFGNDYPQTQDGQVLTFYYNESDETLEVYFERA